MDKCAYLIQWDIIQSLKRNKVLIHATAWMNYKNIILSERSGIQRAHIILFYLNEMSGISKSIETENRFLAA